MPTSVMEKFSVNINNQVITAGNTNLLTIQSNTLLNQIKEKLGVYDGNEQQALVGN